MHNENILLSVHEKTISILMDNGILNHALINCYQWLYEHVETYDL